MFVEKGANDIDVNMFRLFFILYAADIVLFAIGIQDLQNSLDVQY